MNTLKRRRNVAVCLLVACSFVAGAYGWSSDFGRSGGFGAGFSEGGDVGVGGNSAGSTGSGGGRFDHTGFASDGVGSSADRYADLTSDALFTATPESNSAPEPSTAVLLIFGGAGLVLRRSRRG